MLVVVVMFICRELTHEITQKIIVHILLAHNLLTSYVNARKRWKRKRTRKRLGRKRKRTRKRLRVQPLPQPWFATFYI